MYSLNVHILLYGIFSAHFRFLNSHISALFFLHESGITFMGQDFLAFGSDPPYFNEYSLYINMYLYVLISYNTFLFLFFFKDSIYLEHELREG